MGQTPAPLAPIQSIRSPGRSVSTGFQGPSPPGGQLQAEELTGGRGDEGRWMAVAGPRPGRPRVISECGFRP